MLFLNVFCPVCKVQFKKDDAIYSTSCGHTFHFTCMNQWQCRSAICPLCRKCEPETFRIYLNFKELCENDLEAKLVANKKRIAEMQETINKRDRKIDEIQRLYNISEKWRSELQDKIGNLMSNPESKLYSTQGNLLEYVSPENLNFRDKLTACETANLGLNHKIEVLELKLKLATKELKKHVEEKMDQPIINTERKCSSSIFEKSIRPINLNKSTHIDVGSKPLNKDDRDQYKFVIQDSPKA